LDIAKILVLEQWLNEQVYDIPLICISHDRSFLANCTNKTVFLRAKEIKEFNYSYVQASELLQQNEEANAARRSKELKELNRLKKSAHDLRQIGVNNYSAAALKKSIQIAKRAQGIENNLTTVAVEEKRSIKLSNSGIQSKKMIGLEKLTIKTPNGEPLFYIDQLDILQGDRLVIFGANGTGKSQLLKFLHEAAKNPDFARNSNTSVSPSLKPAYIDQHMSHLPLTISVHDYFNQELSLGDQKTTSVLVGAGFPVAIQKSKLSALSPGQRARVAFLTLHLLQPNFYIMDEPTNHLDIEGQEQLEAEIIEQGAGSVVVSHDREFSKKIGTKFYQIENKKLIRIEAPEVYYKKMES
jgi:ATPase subunit of ABC transporter with duplicated ATPase domains